MNNHQKQPQFEWEDFLTLCHFFKSEKYFDSKIPDSLEAVIRTVISRAYYSAFRQTGLHLKLRGFYFDSNLETDEEYTARRKKERKEGKKSNNEDEKDSHNKIFLSLEFACNSSKKNPLYSEIASYLDNLKRQRVKADYCIRLLGNKEDMIELANKSIIWAKEVKEIVTKLNQEYLSNK